MFIGGGSLSTAGGIKVGTFIIVVISVISFYAEKMKSACSTILFLRKLLLKPWRLCITAGLVMTGFMSLLILEPDHDF